MRKSPKRNGVHLHYHLAFVLTASIWQCWQPSLTCYPMGSQCNAFSSPGVPGLLGHLRVSLVRFLAAKHLLWASYSRGRTTAPAGYQVSLALLPRGGELCQSQSELGIDKKAKPFGNWVHSNLGPGDFWKCHSCKACNRVTNATTGHFLWGNTQEHSSGTIVLEPLIDYYSDLLSLYERTPETFF